MSYCRNGEVKIDTGFAAKTEITKKSTQRSDQLLRRFGPTLLRALKQKLPNQRRSPVADIFPEAVQHLGGTPAIKPKRGFGRAPMSPVPIAKSIHDAGFLVHANGLSFRTDSQLDQILMKELCSKPGVIASPPMTVQLVALAVEQVPAKGLQRLRIDVSQSET